MSGHPVHGALPGRLVIVGFGSLGQGSLPLILRHLAVRAQDITIVTADGDREASARAMAEGLGCRLLVQRLTPKNHREVLRALVGRDDFLLNLSVDVSSLALIRHCQAVGALYLDTCIEPWPGHYTDAALHLSQRSNYALRESALRLRETAGAGPGAPTALVTHGANPGLVSHFVKQALLDLRGAARAASHERHNGRQDGPGDAPVPDSREGWARLAQALGVRLIQIAERDTQSAAAPRRRGEFVNTWSVEGFISEGCQPAELGWGSHERSFPEDGLRHGYGSGAAICLNRPGMSQRVRSWTPLEGPYHGFLITHGESISIADHLSLTDGPRTVYRPTCHYAYHPCDDAVSSIHEFAGKGYARRHPRHRVLRDELVDGADELGVLLAGQAQGAYWYGSQLTLSEARRLAPYNSATSLQVCAAVLAGMVWAVEHPRAGVVEPDEIDFRRCLEICRPYLGPVIGVYTDWTPLRARPDWFDEDVDAADPWQFKNVRVA